ncbi:transcription factor E2F7 [Conger conger]|uniref:transcription factor E2F7 n=1 Tax=Conger conger TaxID=82655 RepID=UPI002A59DFC3|nr:transcription factor E2F7 [Conger conger]
MDTECLTLRDLKSVTSRTSITDMDDEEGNVEQKENIFTDRRKATPHKSDLGSAGLGSKKGFTPEQINVTPIKPLERALPEPWTPTTNLKVLISAISPDIRDREMKKILFRPIENGCEETTTLEDPGQFDAPDDGVDEFEKPPSRKQKSLGLLCERFLSLYPDYPASSEMTSISLDEVASSLGVERRRIYDIVNVLESLMLVSRVAKNHYLWHGRRELRQTLSGLQDLGKQQGYHLQIQQLRHCTHRPSAQPTEQSADPDTASGAANRRKEKSLRIMSQKFVMLFLVSETLTVTLDIAAKILIEESQDSASHSKYKTKVRRLYDIANVLTSLGLIQKVHVKEERGRKPAFKWIGPAEFHSAEGLEAVAVVSHAESQVAISCGGRQRLARHASFNMAPTSVIAQRQVSSAPSSPRRDRTGKISEPVDYSRRTGSSSAVCRLQFGDNLGSGGPRSLTPKTAPVTPGPVLPPMAIPIHQDILYGLRPETLLPRLYTTAPQAFSPAPSPMASNPPQDDREPRPQHPPLYLQNLPQASVVLLCGSAALGQGQRSPTSREGVLGKRKMVEEEGREVKRDRQGLMKEETSKKRDDTDGESESSLKTCSPRTSPGHAPQHPATQRQEEAPPRDVAPPSHYLYVPNSAGMNGLNFLLSPGSAPGGLALSQGGMSALALPYVLVPTSALSAYPLVGRGVPGPCADAQGGISFGVPTMVSPAQFVVGGGSFAVAGAPGFPPPEHTPQTHSPREPRQTPALPRMDPQTPLTPKEFGVPTSQAFFQTPGTEDTTNPPTARRRGSAQRRLDVGHPPAD